MRVVSLTEKECNALLDRVSLGRLGCALNNQPYVVPVSFVRKGDQLFVFSTLGKKIEWMRQNPKVCLQADEIGSKSNWSSVLVNGTYQELDETLHAAEREQAKEKLAQYSNWWLLPLAQRREKTEDQSVEVVFFSIQIEAVSGLRGVPEAQ